VIAAGGGKSDQFLSADVRAKLKSGSGTTYVAFALPQQPLPRSTGRTSH
jgi:hypothetical protein